MLDIRAKPISDFLDAVDRVLNSNTFIIEFEISSPNLSESLTKYLNSVYFIDHILKHDLERKWSNLHYYDYDDDCYKIRPGNLLKENFIIKLKDHQFDKKQYLIGMLTGKYGFYSFYSQNKTAVEAEIIVENFISYISKNKEWKLLIVEPDFLVNTTDLTEDSKFDMGYFEGESPCNSSTVIQCQDKSYLLLTNGIP
jgi:hypothetical protein